MVADCPRSAADPATTSSPPMDVFGAAAYEERLRANMNAYKAESAKAADWHLVAQERDTQKERAEREKLREKWLSEKEKQRQEQMAKMKELPAIPFTNGNKTANASRKRPFPVPDAQQTSASFPGGPADYMHDVRLMGGLANGSGSGMMSVARGYPMHPQQQQNAVFQQQQQQMQQQACMQMPSTSQAQHHPYYGQGFPGRPSPQGSYPVQGQFPQHQHPAAAQMFANQGQTVPFPGTQPNNGINPGGPPFPKRNSPGQSQPNTSQVPFPGENHGQAGVPFPANQQQNATFAAHQQHRQHTPPFPGGPGVLMPGSTTFSTPQSVETPSVSGNPSTPQYPPQAPSRATPSQQAPTPPALDPTAPHVIDQKPTIEDATIDDLKDFNTDNLDNLMSALGPSAGEIVDLGGSVFDDFDPLPSTSTTTTSQQASASVNSVRASPTSSTGILSPPTSFPTPVTAIAQLQHQTSTVQTPQTPVQNQLNGSATFIGNPLCTSTPNSAATFPTDNQPQQPQQVPQQRASAARQHATPEFRQTPAAYPPTYHQAMMQQQQQQYQMQRYMQQQEMMKQQRSGAAYGMQFPNGMNPQQQQLQQQYMMHMRMQQARMANGMVPSEVVSGAAVVSDQEARTQQGTNVPFPGVQNGYPVGFPHQQAAAGYFPRNF